MEKKLDQTMQTLLNHVPKFILCHVIGLDMSVYNKATDPEKYLLPQSIINDGLPLLNAAVDSINMNAGSLILSIV